MDFYHGSGEFEVIKRLKPSKTGYLGPGIYLTTDKRVAYNYAVKDKGAGRIYFVRPDLKNVLRVPDEVQIPAQFLIRPATLKRRMMKNGNATYWVTHADIKALLNKGYDGIMWRDELNVISGEAQILGYEEVCYGN